MYRMTKLFDELNKRLMVEVDLLVEPNDLVAVLKALTCMYEQYSKKEPVCAEIVSEDKMKPENSGSASRDAYHYKKKKAKDNSVSTQLSGIGDTDV